ncbi:MAG: hypothetical protein WBW11_22825, partial [Pseudolabrys sp.]
MLGYPTEDNTFNRTELSRSMWHRAILAGLQDSDAAALARKAYPADATVAVLTAADRRRSPLG